MENTFHLHPASLCPGNYLTLPSRPHTTTSAQKCSGRLLLPASWATQPILSWGPWGTEDICPVYVLGWREPWTGCQEPQAKSELNRQLKIFTSKLVSDTCDIFSNTGSGAGGLWCGRHFQLWNLETLAGQHHSCHYIPPAQNRVFYFCCRSLPDSWTHK